LSNSKIARIVANIEYRVPAGTLKDYKYGVKVKRTVAPSQGEPDSCVVMPSIEDARREMNRPIKRPTITEPEIIDG
jgi:hypothetical protein